MNAKRDVDGIDLPNSAASCRLSEAAPRKRSKSDVTFLDIYARFAEGDKASARA